MASSSRTSLGDLKIGSHRVAQPPLTTFRPRRLSGSECFGLGNTKFDLVHLMYYEPSQLANSLDTKGTPLVLTVHDLIHEIREAPPDT